MLDGSRRPCVYAQQLGTVWGVVAHGGWVSSFRAISWPCLWLDGGEEVAATLWGVSSGYRFCAVSAMLLHDAAHCCSGCMQQLQQQGGVAVRIQDSCGAISQACAALRFIRVWYCAAVQAIGHIR